MTKGIEKKIIFFRDLSDDSNKMANWMRDKKIDFIEIFQDTDCYKSPHIIVPSQIHSYKMRAEDIVLSLLREDIIIIIKNPLAFFST